MPQAPACLLEMYFLPCRCSMPPPQGVALQFQNCCVQLWCNPNHNPVKRSDLNLTQLSCPRRKDSEKSSALINGIFFSVRELLNCYRSTELEQKQWMLHGSPNNMFHLPKSWYQSPLTLRDNPLELMALLPLRWRFQSP